MRSDGRFIYVNDAACRSLGYSRAELLTLHPYDIDPDFGPETLPGLWDKVKRLGSLTLTARHKAKDGRVFPVEVTTNYLTFAGMEFNCAFARDISERTQAEDALRKSRDFLQTVLDTMPDPSMVVGVDFRILLANEALRRLTEVAPVSAGLTCHQVSHHSATPCHDPQQPCPLQMVLEFRQPVTVEHVHFNARNEPIQVEISAAPVFDERGDVVQIVLCCRDITDRKTAETSLRESEERFRTIFFESPDAIFVEDYDGRACTTCRASSLSAPTPASSCRPRKPRTLPNASRNSSAANGSISRRAA